MVTETKTIHEVLAELKVLDSRILKKINASTFCLANKHSNTKIDGKTIPEYEAEIKSNFESINDLIRRRAALRNALSRSNATTVIEVGGTKYTMAEAIEMKKSGIELKQRLLMAMNSSFQTTTKYIQNENGEKLSANADKYVASLFGNKDKVSAEDSNNARDFYIKTNTLDLIDPLDAKKQLERLQADIDAFTSEVDAKISVSNATTTVTIEY